MKKKLILIAMVVFTAGIAIAQPRAIGGRLGYNMEVSYQHELTSSMLEVDAGLSPFIYQKALIVDENGMKVPVVYHYGRAQIVLSYDWLESITDGLFLYLGASAGVSWGYGEFFDLPRYNRQGVLTTYRRLGLPIGAQIGLEYDFSIPLNLSLDWRPMVNMFGLRQGDLTSNLLNIAIGVRYRF
jgi:hypothetical protein